jgi:hypothetical protein
VDRTGVPVLVEVKRAVDTRIRREVVAQMMDYASAAHAWDANSLRLLFQETNSDNEQILQSFDTDEFWARVSTNLKADNLKLVFVADSIPSRLRNMIEFLDRNMDGITVYGVEVRQFKTSDSALVTSNLIQSTTKEQKSQSKVVTIKWTLESLLEHVTQQCGQSISSLTDRLIAFTRDDLGLQGALSKGKTGTYYAKLHSGEGFMSIFCVSSGTYVSFHKPNTADRLGGTWTPENVKESILSVLPRSDQIFDYPKYFEFNIALLSDLTVLGNFQDLLTAFHKTMCTNGRISSPSSQDETLPAKEGEQ